MKVCRLLIVLFLINAEAGATGYSNNMFVAQRMLKVKSITFTMPIVNRDGTVARVVPLSSVVGMVGFNDARPAQKSLVQYISDWMAGWITPGEASPSEDRPIAPMESETETGQQKLGNIFAKWLAGCFAPLRLLFF